MSQSTGLLWRAILAFLALPTVVAFVVPWLFSAHDSRFASSAAGGRRDRCSDLAPNIVARQDPAGSLVLGRAGL